MRKDKLSEFLTTTTGLAKQPMISWVEIKPSNKPINYTLRDNKPIIYPMQTAKE